MSDMQTLEGSSATSASDALQQALAAAIGAARGKAHTHIVVQAIMKMGKGWRAVVSVITEPKLEEPHPEPARAELRPHELREESEEKEKLRHFLDMAWQHIEEHNLEMLERAQEWDNELMLIYMEMELEDVFTEIASAFDLVSVHYLPEGPLMDAAQNLHPDMDLYEAAHDGGQEPAPAQDNEPAPRRAPKEEPEYEEAELAEG